MSSVLLNGKATNILSNFECVRYGKGLRPLYEPMMEKWQFEAFALAYTLNGLAEPLCYGLQ